MRDIVIVKVSFPSVDKWEVKIVPPPRHHASGVIASFLTKEEAEEHKKAILDEFKTVEAAAESVSKFIERSRA